MAEPSLQISLEKICYIVMKAREFDAKDVLTEPDPGSDPVDDGMVSVLEDHDDDPVEEELTAFIDALNVDEQADLVALTWLGRGDNTIDGWDELRREAASRHRRHTANYLLGIPLLPDFLEEGLDAFGLSCEGEEEDRL
ncbi:MAG TPA: DUF3775 domain-containing protein [Kiloniellales bacterium]|nr:DUF3775 domain-containing protein [Kiloniellales bacterium]